MGRSRGSLLDRSDVLVGALDTQAIIPERYRRRIVRAFVLSNMLPDSAHPERGTFVRDQVADLRRLQGLDIELYEFPPGRRALARAAMDLRRRYGGPSTLALPRAL
jgi:hypothetical protein